MKEYLTFGHRDKWDVRFYEIALQFRRWSKDPSTQVGAVIARGRHIVGTGYNGPPAGVNDEVWLRTRELKLEVTLHAELNAILDAKCDVTGLTMYTTHFPCPPCAAVICQSGIAVLKTAYDDQGDYELRYAERLEISRLLLEDRGVVVDCWLGSL